MSEKKEETHLNSTPFKKQNQRLLRQEKLQARLNLLPLLQAEEDRL